MRSYTCIELSLLVFGGGNETVFFVPLLKEQ